MSSIHSLEFDTVCGIIGELCASPVCAELVRNTTPTDDIVKAKKILEKTGDALYILTSRRPDLAFDDVLPILSKAKVGAVLLPAELLSIKRGILCLKSLKTAVEESEGCDSLKDVTAWVRVCDDLEREISDTVQNETDLKDSASEKLYNIRRAITRANAKLKERLDSLTRKSEISKFLQDNIVTIRDGRYVVPVKSECRSEVKGLVHDISSTGATVFVEPFAIVEANNELKTLKTEEAIEVERILSELSKSVARNAHELSEGQRVLSECGVIFAKAEYAKKINAFCPKLNNDGKISLKAARHPLIDPNAVVPVDIEFDSRILLVSGPNTGGKTVVLKTVGLFALMAASGIFLPTAENSEIAVFNDIFCDIGDAQSIAQSLSTFSSHIKNIAAITEKMNETSLVLLDEVGDGTDPDDGAALAVAILKRIIKAKSTAVVTTHFNAVKEFALSSEHISNASMQFDNTFLAPTYKLIRGVAGSSYALEIAERLGLDKEIISDAKKSQSAERIAFDNMMKETERLMAEARREKAEYAALLQTVQDDLAQIQKIKTEYEKKLSDIKEKSRELVRKRADEYAEKAEELIDEIKQKLRDANDAALFEARKAAKKLSDIPADEVKPKTTDKALSPDELKANARVYISGLEKEGLVVAEPRGGKVTVAIGSLKTEVPISSLTLVESKKEKSAHVPQRETPESKNIELMMLGYTVDDATEELDRVLSDIPPRSTIRVVHGKGTGALGKGIQNYLRRHPRVKSFRYGRYGEGDTGVTIVEIK
ncbi:MAG: endonuclease MutS2 [Clostridiales bacterium]|nr:endonuclease MutS2 [Clostridiales bacterium]